MGLKKTPHLPSYLGHPLPQGERARNQNTSPLPWGEGGPRPALLRAGAGRVRGFGVRDTPMAPAAASRLAETPQLRLRFFHPRGLEPQTRERGLRYSLPMRPMRVVMKHLTILTFFVLTVVGSIGAHEVSPNASPATTARGGSVTKLDRQQETDRAKQADAKPSPELPCTQCINCCTAEEPHTKTKGEEAKEASLDRLYRRYLWATIIGVAGGFIGLGILVWQTVISRQAAYAAKTSAEAIMNAERPWVLASMGQIQECSIQDPSNPFWGSLCTIENFGKTPAWVKSWISQRGNLEEDSLPQEPRYIPIEDFTPQVLTPGQKLGRLMVWNRDQLNQAHSDKLFLYVIGFVDYRDSFGNTHETRFCFRYYPPFRDNKVEGFYVVGSEEYNRQT